MARRTKKDASRTHQLLIDAAIQQFALRGVASTTLTDIADAAGVTRGAVYWHFSSKAELFNEIWRQQLPLRNLIQQELNLGHNPELLNQLRDKFIAGLQYIAVDSRQRALMQILYHKCEFTDEMMSESEIRQRIGFSYSAIGEVLQACIRNRLLPAETNIEIVLIVLHATFSGIIKNWLLAPQRLDLFGQAPALVGNIMSALCIPQRREDQGEEGVQ
ncbi:acrEF/envCD operon transcriptional regulator [Klebsiella sp. I138]|uniref:acrEF/envCD operon transcriptional regulator n=1 Tax=Klebsiella sp. I138 TaxID=2755385 RepID=UPI003DA964FE